jgi:hypothetical protein
MPFEPVADFLRCASEYLHKITSIAVYEAVLSQELDRPLALAAVPPCDLWKS